MPNYAINAVYQPFSFQERMTPLQMMNEEYNKVGEALSELGNDVNQYYRYLDDDSRAIVDDYNNTLDDIATSFSREGLKTVSRNTLFNLKRAYKTQIEPINEAAKSLATMQEQYRELAIKDPTMIITGMPTVSELMSNPNAAPSAVSGAALYKQGTLAASQLPDVSYEQMQRYLEGDTTAIPNIDAIGASIAQMYGTDNEQAYGYIMQGIRDGISARTAEMNSYTQKQNILLQNELDKIKYQTDQQIRLDNVRTANDIRVKTTPGASSDGSSSGSSKKSTIDELNKKAWGTSRIVLGRDRDTSAKNFVDNKTGRIIIPDAAFDKDGYYHLPQDTKYTYTGQYGNQISSTRKDSKQEKLYSVLSNYYSDEELTNMTRVEVERAVRGLVNEANLDGQMTNVYEWPLDSNGTKSLISRIGNGKKFNKIKGRGENGEYIYGRGEDIDDDKGSGQIMYDANNNTVLLHYDNSYYKIPMSVISSEYLTSLQSITNAGGSGLSALRQTQLDIEDIENRMTTLQQEYKDIITRGGTPPQSLIDEYNAYYQVYTSKQNDLEQMDEILNGVGNHIMTYVGNRNLNTN